MINNKGVTKLIGRKANNIPFLTNPGEPTDRDSEYLSKGPQSSGKLSNSRNLFDDNNKTDGKWLRIAAKYLSVKIVSMTPR